MMISPGFNWKRAMSMRPSWTQPPSRVAAPTAAKASIRRNTVPPIRRSDGVIIYCTWQFGERR
jgi:hypothetical protein